MKYPNLVACLNVMSAASQDYNAAIPYMKFTPIWESQGGKDTGPTPATASVVVNAYEGAGADFRYNLYTTLGHDTWDSAWAQPDYFPFILRAHQANPWTLYGKSQFCPGAPINVTIGIMPGFSQYQWRMNGNIITGATSDSLKVTQPGIYDCRFLNGTYWSPWSPRPDTIGYYVASAPPPITINGTHSDVVPAPDGSTTVPLMVPSGYSAYAWQKVDSTTILSTTNTLTAPGAGLYEVKVTDALGCASSYSAPFTVINAGGANPPAAVTGLSASTLGLTAVALSWNTNPNATNPTTNYELYQGTKSGGPYQLIAILSPGVLNDTLKTLNPGVTYYYVVRAINGTAAAAVSNEARTTTQQDTQAPTTPANLTVTGTTINSVALSWTASTDNVGVTEYDIYINGQKSYSTASTTFTAYNLIYQQPYTFYVKARDFAGNVSQPSNQVNAEPLAKGLNFWYYTNTTAWTALPNFNTLTPVSSGITNNVSITGATQTTDFGYLWEGILNVTTAGTYTLETVSHDGSRLWLGTLDSIAYPYNYNGTSVINNDGIHNTATKQYTVNLQVGQYPIAIAYFQATGTPAMSVLWKVPGATTYVKIPDSAFVEKPIAYGQAPSLPGGLTAKATSFKNVNLSWTDTSTIATGYEIWRSLNGLTGFSSVATVPGSATTYSDSNYLNPSTTYYYKVRAIGTNGNSVLVPNNNLAAKWQFNSNYNDSSGNGLTLTPANTPTFDPTDTKEGSASLVLNGTNQYATIPSTTLLQGGYSAMTVAFWMKSANNTGARIIADLGGNDNGLALRLDASKLYAGVASASNRQSFSVAYTSTTWNHIALVYSGKTLLLYVNGVLAGSNTSLPFTSVGTTTNASRIGTNNSSNAFNTGTGFFSGKLDNFVIYNTALSVSDVNAVMNNTYGYVTATTAALPAVSAVPYNLAASGTSQTKVSVTWSDTASSETGLQLYRSATTDVNYVLLATLAPHTTSFVDTGLFANALYYYKIRSMNPGGSSAFSPETSATTLDYTPVIKNIAPLQYMRYGTTLQIPVTAADSAPQTLAVQVSNMPAFGTYTASGNGTGTISFVPGATQQGVYNNITVTVTDQHGGTANTSFGIVVDSIYTPVIAPVNNVTMNPKATASVTLTASDSTSTAQLTWSFTGLPGFATVTTSGNQAQIALAPGYSDNGTYTVQAKISDTSHRFDTVSFVIKVNKVTPAQSVLVNFNDGTINAAAPWNNTANKTPAAGTTFSGLLDSTGKATTIRIQLQTAWTGVNDLGVNTGSNSGVFPDAVLETSYYTSAAQTVRVVGLDPNNTYSFTMTGSRANATVAVVTSYTVNGQTQTVNAANNSTLVAAFTGIKPAADSSVTFTVNKAAGSTYGYLNALVIRGSYNDSTAPAKPRNFTAAVQGRTAVLNWTDAAYNETSYSVFRSTSLSGPFTALTTTGAIGLQQYTDSTVIGNTTYYYMVAPVNQFGTTYSDTVSLTTPDLAPLLAALGNVTMKTGQTVTVNVSATTDTTNTITLAASNLPAFGTFVDNGNGTGTLTLTPGSTKGVFNGVTVTATDSHGQSASQQFSVTVIDSALDFTYVNFNQTLPAAAPWNNMNSAPTAGAGLTNLVDGSGNATGMNISLTEAWSGATNTGVNTGNNSGIYPDAVMETFYYETPANTQHVVLSGLSASKRYNLVFFASRANYTSALITNYTVGSTTVQLDANNNSTNTVQINDITPDVNGDITVSIVRASSSANAYLGAMVIQSYNYNNTPVAPASLTATGSSKTAIQLNWQQTTDSVSDYEIWRSASVAGPFTKIGDAGAALSYVDSGLVSGATEYYEVRSLSPGGYSPYSNVAGASTVYFSIELNMNDGATGPAQPAPWNNTNTLIANGFTLQNMINDQFLPTGVNFTVVNNFDGYNNVGATTGNNSGIVPDNVSKSLYYVNYGDSAVLQISGLDQTWKYNFGFFASRVNPVVGVTSTYRIGGQTVQLDATNNTSRIAWLEGIKPDSTGSITFSVSAALAGGFGYLNALFVQGTPGVSGSGSGSGGTGGTKQATAVDMATASRMSMDSTTDSTKANVLNSVTAFPNPFVNDVTLRLDLSSEVGKFLVVVTDISGRVIMEKEYYNAGPGVWQQNVGLNGSRLPKGMYLIQVTGIPNQAPQVFKIIKW